MNGKYILLGSNLGDKKENIRQAGILVRKRIGPVLRSSSLYLTSSWGVAHQPDYINQVLLMETSLAPSDLLKNLLDIESFLGRERRHKWENRLIDLDILFYDDQIIHDQDLIIPHPEIANRKFTLAPLNEIAPDEIHPGNGLSMRELLESTGDAGKVVRL